MRYSECRFCAGCGGKIGNFVVTHTVRSGCECSCSTGAVIRLTGQASNEGLSVSSGYGNGSCRTISGYSKGVKVIGFFYNIQWFFKAIHTFCCITVDRYSTYSHLRIELTVKVDSLDSPSKLSTFTTDVHMCC